MSFIMLKEQKSKLYHQHSLLLHFFWLGGLIPHKHPCKFQNSGLFQ